MRHEMYNIKLRAEMAPLAYLALISLERLILRQAEVPICVVISRLGYSQLFKRRIDTST